MSCKRMGSGNRGAQKAGMGKKVLPRVVAETRVQAMQLKLFIEISVLQKHEKTQIQSGGQRGL